MAQKRTRPAEDDESEHEVKRVCSPPSSSAAASPHTGLPLDQFPLELLLMLVPRKIAMRRVCKRFRHVYDVQNAPFFSFLSADLGRPRVPKYYHALKCEAPVQCLTEAQWKNKFYVDARARFRADVRELNSISKFVTFSQRYDLRFFDHITWVTNVGHVLPYYVYSYKIRAAKGPKYWVYSYCSFPGVEPLEPFAPLPVINESLVRFIESRN